MNPHLSDFLKIIETENRYEALRFVLDKLEERSLSILQVYEELLTPALNQMTPSGNENLDIWKEHVRTSIIKTIVENMYPYVIRERQTKGAANGRTAAVLCPPEEYHDLGARMAADVLTLSGYEAIFVGGNTPLRVYTAGLAEAKIDFIVISISNPYHLVSGRNIIQGIREKAPAVKIVVGGNAIGKLGDRAKVLEADYTMTTLHELAALEGGLNHETGI